MEAIFETVCAMDSAFELRLCLYNELLHAHPLFVFLLSIGLLIFLRFLEVDENDTHK